MWKVSIKSNIHSEHAAPIFVAGTSRGYKSWTYHHNKNGPMSLTMGPSGYIASRILLISSILIIGNHETT